MENVVWLCNPPYNDGSKGNAQIYQHFVEQVRKHRPKAAVIITQANWMMQVTALGRQMREDLKSIGIKRLILNPVDAFPNAQVRTVSMICEPGYHGPIELIDVVNNEQRFIDDFYELIPFVGNADKVGLLLKLKPNKKWTTWAGDEGNTNSWRIAVSYKNFEIKKDPLGEFKILEPDYEKQSGYRVFAEFNSEPDAQVGLFYYNSFFKSKLATFILRYTRVSNTLDNPQIAWLPKIAIDQIYTDQDLYTKFSLNEKDIGIIENDINS